MLNLLIRRTLAQRRLLAGIVVLVTVGTAILGVGALMLGTTQDHAFTAALQQTTPQDVDVTAFLVGVKSSDAADVTSDARAAVRDVLGTLDPTVSSTAVSRMRRLADGEQLGYLATTDSLAERAVLTSGRWVRAPGEAVVPQSAAAHLNLAPGDTVTLGAETGTAPVASSVTVTVVGTFRTSSRSSWTSDTLAGLGYDADYSNGTVSAPASGPFVVDDATFEDTGSTVDALQVSGHPAVTRLTGSSVARAVTALRSADGLLSARVHDRADISRIASNLPDTLVRARAQQSSTRSTVLVVLLLSVAMSLTALLLAGRLLSGVRDTERALLSSRGLGRRQAALSTMAETLAVAVTAMVLAVPLAALAHHALTHLPAMRAAGLSQGPTVTPGLVLTEAVGAVLLALALAVPLLRTARAGGRVAVAARSGIDLLLVATAVAAWWELHAQPSASASGDVTRTLAPVVAVTAATTVAVRCAAPILTVVAAAASRSAGLVLPLASSQAARRPHADAAFLLLAMAAASATFGLSVQSTWEQSQDDQAALRAGTGLAITLSAPATDRDATSIRAATGGSVTSAVTRRPLTLGRYVGDPGSPPLLVAVDSRRAGALLSGRLDHGRSWSGIGNLLAPGPRVAGLAVSSHALSVTGTAPAGVRVDVTPTLVVEDASGFRSTVNAGTMALDGHSHPLTGLTGLDRSRLVAIRLALTGRPGSSTDGTAAVSVALSVGPRDAATGGAADDHWDIRALDAKDSPVRGSTVTVDSTAVRATAVLDLPYLAFAGGDLLATAFTAPDVLPVAVSQDLADVVGVAVGGELRSTVDGVDVPVKIVAVVPTVPSAPGRVAVLADGETMSRMLVGAGHLEPAVDAWWVADPPSRVSRALRSLGLGDVVTRATLADQLRQGPLQSSVPAALTLLVVAACLLLLAGVALVIGADRRSRSPEVARLRAMGLPRRTVTRLVLTEHGIVLVLLVLAGAAVGLVASYALGPDLIRSDQGSAPVPDAVLDWPWVQEVAVVTGLLGGCLVIAATITVVVVRRSGPEQLRMEDA